MAEQVTTLRLAIDSREAITAQKNLDGMAQSSKNLDAGVATLTKTLLGSVVAFGSITAAASSFISTAGKFEQYATSLKVLSGSAAEAEKNFAWVKDFTAKTPYTLDQTMEAFIRLKAYGIDATSGSLKTLGDTSAAMGKPLMAAVEAMADAMTGENERLKEFGIRASVAGDTISYKWRDASNQARDVTIKNNSEIIQSTLEAIFNDKYAGMMDEQSKTWTGAVSNLEDTWTSFKDEIARNSGIFDTAKTVVMGMTEALNGQNETLNKYLPMIEALAVTYGVMKGASLAATATETALAAVRAQSTVTTTAYNAALTRSLTATTALTSAQVAGAIASRAMGAALSALPVVAVAGTVLALAGSFFEASKKSDDLKNSIDATVESLRKLSKAQLDVKRNNISEELQSVGLERRQLEQKYGPKAGRTSEQQAEIDALKSRYSELIAAGAKVATVQTEIREGAKGSAAAHKEEAASLDDLLKKYGTDAPEKAKKLTAAQKQAIKDAKELEETKKAAVEHNAEVEAQLALDLYTSEQAAIQHNYDMEAQLALDLYTSEQAAIQDSHDLRASLAVQFYEMTKSETDSINEKYKAIYEANVGLWSDEQMAAFFQKWQAATDGVKGGYSDIQNMIDGLGNVGADFSQSFTGAAKNIANASKALTNFTKITKEYAKAREKINTSTELTEDQKRVALKEVETKEMQDQIGAYANLAGAASAFFKEGSDGAKALQIAQAGLAMTSAVMGIAEQARLPFPANIAAMTSTAATVFSFLSSAGIMGGGGGGSSAKAPSAEEIKKQNLEGIENSYKPITDRLDRQIQIMEDVGLKGSAGKVGITVGQTEYKRDLEKLNVEFLDSMGKGLLRFNSISASAGYFENFAKITNIAAALPLAKVASLKAPTAGDVLSPTKGPTLADLTNEYYKMIGAAQEAITGYAESMVGTVKTMDDAGETFKNLYDSLTNSTKYADEKLLNATGIVNSLIGSDSIVDYLERNIRAIDDVSAALGYDVKRLLVSTDVNDIAKQVAAVDELARVSNRAFEGGVEEALNYIDSIEMVASAMAQSNSNIRSFTDSLLSDAERLQNMAASFSVSVPQTMAELMATFDTLTQGVGGLTNDELKFLNTSKDAIDEKLSAEKAAQDKAAAEAQRLAEEEARAAAKAADEKARAEAKAQEDQARAAAEAAREQARLIEEQRKRMASFFETIADFVAKMRGEADTLSQGTTYAAFTSAFDAMLQGVASKAENISELGAAAMAAASGYIDMVAKTAGSASEIAFTKLSIASRFEGIPRGFASGGYTGNLPANTVAGLVHGQEYVLNAKTTRDLGLNNSAGVFVAMNRNIAQMANKIESLAGMAITQTATQVKTLSTQRAILDAVTTA